MNYIGGTIVRIRNLALGTPDILGIVVGYDNNTINVKSEDGIVLEHKMNLLISFKALKVMPYDKDAWNTWTKTKTLNQKEFLYVQDSVVNKYIQPFIYQFGDSLRNKKSKLIYKLTKVSWEGNYNIGKTRRAPVIDKLRGLNLYLTAQDTWVKGEVVSLLEIMQDFELP